MIFASKFRSQSLKDNSKWENSLEVLALELSGRVIKGITLRAYI